MKFFLVVLGLHLLVLACNAKKDGKDEKELVTLDERPKRASAQDELKILRQAAEVPPEYLSLLQQLSAQRDQTAAAQQPQYIQQLVLSKDGLKQTVPTRYILSQDGRLLEDNVYLSQQPQQFAQAPAPAQYAFQQQPQPVQAQQPQIGRPVVNPELAAFSRQQQRLQQEYADAPIRAQIASGAARARQRPVAPVPTPAGPNSQSPQVFAQSQPRTEPRLRPAVPSETPNFVYAPVPTDAQSILQQQLAQLSLASDADGRQFYTQASRPIQPQQIIYQQPTQQEFAQERVVYQQQQPFPTRRPVQVTPTPQPATLPQNLPQQYLIETTRPQSQPVQYVPQEVTPQVQYVQPSQVVPQQSAKSQANPQQYQSTLLQPVNSRGLFDPKPSRSSIFVSRSSSTPRPAVPLETEPTSQKIPVVRLPSPTDQRPLTRQELDALVSAGYNVQPVPVPVLVPEPSLPANYLKSKRQQPVVVEDNKNHVVYENRQDGVQYQYSPGSSVAKIKKSVSPTEDGKNTQRAVVDRNDSNPVLAYVLAVGGESS